MRITQKQAFLLVSILQSSLTKNVVGYLCYDQKTRADLLNEIANQQGDEIIDVEETTREESK